MGHCSPPLAGTDFRDLSFIEVQLQPAAAAAAAPPPGSPKGLSTPPLGSPRAASAEEREEILRRAATRLRGTSVLQRRTFLRVKRLRPWFRFQRCLPVVPCWLKHERACLHSSPCWSAACSRKGCGLLPNPPLSR